MTMRRQMRSHQLHLRGRMRRVDSAMPCYCSCITHQDAHVPGRVALVQIPQHLLDLELRAPIRIGDADADGRVLSQWRRGAAVYGARGRKHDALAAGGAHGLQQVDAGLHIVGVVKQRVQLRLPHGLVARKVDDRLELVCCEERPQRHLVAHIELQRGRR